MDKNMENPMETEVGQGCNRGTYKCICLRWRIVEDGFGISKPIPNSRPSKGHMVVIASGFSGGS